ncbi:MAG: DUF262 domain-containing protein [Prevotella sp.]|nr:DUF262 domain-containing protein [Prevotella sp.]
MKIEQKAITIRDLVDGYEDKEENGIVGYGGKLNIRPPYQREFIYKPEQQEAVIDTILKKFPLNTMYWAKTDDGNYEIIDGQQRTVSICRFCHGDFAFDFRYFANLTDDEKDKILDYPLTVYICEGTDSEKLAWFKVINIAGEKLTDQELRNAVYAGSWLADAKRYFSKSTCAAYQMGKDYISGSPIRQELLETVLKWISKGNIDIYMAKHQHDPNANELWMYFRNVITWIQVTFPKKRPFMKGVDWGYLYDNYHDKLYDTQKLEERIQELIIDDDVKNSGIYFYLLTGKEKYLHIRDFTPKMKLAAYERQKGICAKCGKHFEAQEMEADHITPWSKGGATIAENCQMLCRDCNRRKSDK